MIKLTKWNWFERIWLVSFLTVAVIITILSKDNFFGFTVFLSGVLCVILAAKGSALNYLVGLYNCIGYAYIAFQNKLFGEFFENIFFFIPTAIIGYFMWKRNMNQDIVVMKRLRKRTDLILAIGVLLVTALLGYLLSRIAGQNTPYIDAATNVLNAVATILMMLRFREQWACYIATNILSVTMWGYRVASGSEGALLMLVMWLAYLVNSFYGYWNWSKGSKKIGGEK